MKIFSIIITSLTLLFTASHFNQLEARSRTNVNVNVGTVVAQPRPIVVQRRPCRPMIVRQAPCYYAPAPVVVYEAPVYYREVVYAPAPAPLFNFFSFGWSWH